MKAQMLVRGRSALISCVIVALVAGTFLVALAPVASADISGSTGPINVTVSPTTGLTDGQTVNISATATSGTMSEIRAHISDQGCETAPEPRPLRLLGHFARLRHDRSAKSRA